MRNLIRRKSTRRRRARTFGVNPAAECAIRHTETLESRALLTALIPKIALNQATILPSINGLQLLASQNGGTTDLYTTDGTQEGTIKFSTIPGQLFPYESPNSVVTDYAIVGQDLYFNAYVADGVIRHSIWKTDGTSSVKLLEQSVWSPTLPSGFTEFGGFIYFAATDADAGRELWKSDGTIAGTTLAVDVIPGTASSNPRQLRVFDGQLFFTAGATETVYRTNGTSAGTVSVIDGDTQWSPLSDDLGTVAVAVASSKLILKRESVAGGIDLLVMTSATTTPTVIHTWIPAANSSFIIGGFTVVGANAFFQRADTSSGRLFGELWKTNGTTVGTVSPTRVFDMNVSKFGLTNTFFPGVYPDAAGDRLVFFADGQTSYGLWHTDATTLTQIPLSPETAKPVGQRSLIAHGGRMYSIVYNLSIFEVTEGLTSGRQLGGYSNRIDGLPRQVTRMLGGVWFASDATLWRIDADLPDAIPGPTPAGGLGFPGALGTTLVNGQHVFRISWNSVPGAVGYRINGVDSGTALSIDIPYVNENDYAVRVQAILPSGQLSNVSEFTFRGFLNSTNLSFVNATPFTQSVILRRDIGTTWLYRAEFLDPVSGQVVESSTFRWTATDGNMHQAVIPFPAAKIPVHGRLAVRVSPFVVSAPQNAATASFELVYSEISASFSGNSTTISWPAVGGPAGYDLWINDETRGILQYIRNQNLTTSSFTHTFPTGTYKVWVRPKDFSQAAWSQPQLITVGQAPKLLSPIGPFAKPNVVPKFQWPIVKGATGFELWVNQIGGTTKIIHETALPGNSTSFRPLNPLPHGRYQAWIRSQGTGPGHGVWSAPINFTINPFPVQPVVATGQFDPTPTITWTAPFAGIKYELWIGKTDGTQVFRQANITTTSFTLPTALANGNYKVSLRGVTADGLILPWSNQDKVLMTIGLQGHVIPSLTGSRTLTWNQITGATRYDIWMNYVSGSQPAQSQIYRNENATGSSIILPSSLPAGNYRVWMRAIHVEGSIAFMTDWTPNGTTFAMS